MDGFVSGGCFVLSLKRLTVILRSMSKKRQRDSVATRSAAAKVLGARGGRIGGKAQVAKGLSMQTPEKLAEIVRRAASPASRKKAWDTRRKNAAKAARKSRRR